ncbi:MAG: hypothetical protein EKK41_17790 [Hyphomicrobiales bacterium]|nr:MAG: hypothetical protein EKK41_17790 [Hyphomicrobiales bacterium]
MGKFVTSFGIGFATAAVVGVALFGVMRPAEAHDYWLSDWVRMSPDAKLAHARDVVGDGEGRMERARSMLFCLHDAAKAGGTQSDVNLREAVSTCRSLLHI